VIEVAVQVFSLDEMFGSFETLVDPERDIPVVSQRIHHISPEMLEGKPKIQEVLPRVLELLDHHTVVGHGILFDLAILEAEASRSSIQCSFEGCCVIDTLRLARLYGDSPINSLQQLRSHFNIAEEGAHRAMSDVMVNIAVFKHLIRSFHTLQEIVEALSRPIQMKTMPLGKHKGRRFEEIPTEYLRWAEKKDFDEDLLYSIRVELKRRRKGATFFQASNPFSSL
jgi:DNA polymerase-3 subunit epsilon